MHVVGSGNLPPRVQRKAWEATQEAPERVGYDVGMKSTVETPESQRGQNIEHLLRKDLWCEQSQLTREAVWTAFRKAIGRGLPTKPSPPGPQMLGTELQDITLPCSVLVLLWSYSFFFFSNPPFYAFWIGNVYLVPWYLGMM